MMINRLSEGLKFKFVPAKKIVQASSHYSIPMCQPSFATFMVDRLTEADQYLMPLAAIKSRPVTLQGSHDMNPATGAIPVVHLRKF